MISLIIPMRNEERFVAPCLESVLAQLDGLPPCEILCVDGASTDRTREIVSTFTTRDPRVILINNQNKTVPFGMNLAIGLARGDIVIRLDCHTVYAPDYVRRCIETLKRTGADNVGGAARTKADSYMQSAVAAAYHSPFSVGGARFHNADYEGYVDTVTYGCWRKAAFERFGCFDEELARNQDDEHNLRIIRGGGKIWQSAEIKSWYRPRSSLSALFRQYLQYGYWKVRVIQKHRLPASIRHLVPGVILVAFFALGLLGAIWHPAWWVLVMLLVGYAFANLAASVHCALKSQLSLLPVLPAVFASYHLGYGTGFLCGIWDFVIRRKAPSTAFTSLTRDEVRL